MEVQADTTLAWLQRQFPTLTWEQYRRLGEEVGKPDPVDAALAELEERANPEALSLPQD